MQPSKPAKPKKSIFKKWWFWVIVVIVAFIAIGALGGGGDEDNKDAGATPTPKATTAPTATTTPKDETLDYKNGMNFNLDDLSITLSNARTTDKVGYYEADAGKMFFVFDAEYKNNTDTEISSLLYMFTVYDADGNKIEKDIMASDSANLYGTIAAGKKASGSIGFELTDAQLKAGIEIYATSTSILTDKKVIIKYKK